MKTGSYQFEKLEGRHGEAAFLDRRAALRIDGFVDLVLRHGLNANDRILEVGCAQGARAHRLAEQFPESRIIGVDRSPELLAEARNRYRSASNLRFEEADLYALPFPDGSFDFIYVRLVFMHLTDPRRAVASLHRVLRQGGRILLEDADRNCMIFDPAPASFGWFWDRVQEGQRRLGGDPNVGSKLSGYLKNGGFENIKNEPQPIVGDGHDIGFLVETLMPSLNIYLDPSERIRGAEAIEDLGKLAEDPNATFYHFWFVTSGAKA